MIKHYFVTGTDTAVGKTISSVALLQSAKLAGFVVAGYKPVASNSKMTAEGLRNEDALALQYHSSTVLNYKMINPYTFSEPTSPHIVSIDEHRPILFSVLSNGLRALEKKANWIIIEGAGGWFTPLTNKETFADWVTMEQLPIILVVGIKLGCINHALLTAMAIKKSNLHLSGWIANEIMPPIRRNTEYLETLKRMLSAPFLGKIPWINHLTDYQSLDKYLDIKYLKYE